MSLQGNLLRDIHVPLMIDRLRSGRRVGPKRELGAIEHEVDTVNRSPGGTRPLDAPSWLERFLRLGKSFSIICADRVLDKLWVLLSARIAPPCGRHESLNLQ